MTLLKLVPLWLWLALAAGGVIGLQHWRLSVVNTDLAQAQTDNTQLAAAVASLRQTAALQRQLAKDTTSTETTYQQAIDDAYREKTRLDAALADATVRLSVKGRCVPAARADHPATGQSDGDTFRLDPAAERDYSTLRAGLSTQRAQIVGLQQYVQTLIQYCRIGG